MKIKQCKERWHSFTCLESGSVLQELPLVKDEMLV